MEQQFRIGQPVLTDYGSAVVAGLRTNGSGFPEVGFIIDGAMVWDSADWIDPIERLVP